MSNLTKAEKIEDVAKRRGFFWPGSEIHGGVSGLYDYGHLGTLLKRRFENLWRKYYLDEHNFYEIETTNIMPEPVFVASGHISNFIDPVARCKKCGTAHRADHIMEEFLNESFEGMTPQQLTELIKKHNVKCPNCKGPLEDVAVLNMMFPLHLGTGNGIRAFLRPETAQGAYVSFKRVYEHLRRQLPIGLAIVGKAFRNEISPRNLLIRQREFTQAEVQIFFDPDQINIHPRFEEIGDYILRLYSIADRKSATITEISCIEAVKKLKMPQFYVFYLAKIQKFYLDVLKLPRDKFRFRELSEEERAFYNKLHWDVELDLESLGGFKEVGGLHYRTDHDLAGHQNVSREKLAVTINGRTFIPHVIEESFGVDRNVFALLDLGYTEEPDRLIFKFPRILSTYDAAVFPLVGKDGLPQKAQAIFQLLCDAGFIVFYDESGSIGRRYRRMDEIGTAASITIDHETLENETVTIRDRDSMKQIRVPIDDLVSKLKLFIAGEDIVKLGEVIKL